MLTTQTGGTVSFETFDQVFPFLQKVKEDFDPNDPEQIDEFVTEIDFLLWKEGIEAPEGSAEALVGYTLTGEVNFSD